MEKVLERLKNIGRCANGRRFLRDLYVFIKCWRKGFYLTYWDGRIQDYKSDTERVCLNHDNQGRIVDVDIHRGLNSTNPLGFCRYYASMQDEPDAQGCCGIARKKW